MTRTAMIGVVLIGTLVTASMAAASRPPTRSEENVIEFAFRNAHYDNEDGLSLRSIREVRVSEIDDRWAAVLYRKAKRGSKKLGIEFYRRGATEWRHKRKPPRPIAKDLKQPAEPYLVDIGYSGSGSLRYDFTYAEESDTQNEHVGADFSWDLQWRGVELYDDHYPAGDDTPDINTGQGTWDYSYADSLPGGECTTSGLLQSAFEGTVLVERGSHKGEVDITVEEPTFLGGMGSCLDRDFWWIAGTTLPEFPYPTIRGVPTFPTGRIELPVSSASCGEIVEPYGSSTCTYGLSGTIAITPQ